MKFLITILLFSLSLNAKTIKEGDQEYSCNPIIKKTCEDELKKANAEIRRLKAKKPVEVVKEVIKEVDKTNIKKHIVSLDLHSGVTSNEVKTSSTNTTQTAEGKIETGYVPSLNYQYQFDSGLVPKVGVDIQKNPKLNFGLGYEF